MAPEISAASRVQHPLLAVRSLSLSYSQRRLIGPPRNSVTALDAVSFDLAAGQTLALVGPSGSGKSSLARCLVLLEKPTSGQILYDGQDILQMNRIDLKHARRDIQLIFQDSASALNPALTVEEILREPLAIHEPKCSSSAKLARIREVMASAELPAKWLRRSPLDLSGGQRQRVAIARSLILKPKILILDEPLSALDLSTQGQIANLFIDLQDRHCIAFLLITHDIHLASSLAHHAAILSSGRIIARGNPSILFTANLHSPPASLRPESPSRETISVS